MTDTETMQQALEALEYASTGNRRPEIIGPAITALRTALAQEHALHELARLGQEIEQEPSAWRDMIVVSLVREGIDKHRARELADHFAAQRPWQGLTPEEMKHLYPYGKSVWGKETYEAIEKALKERNHG